MNAVDILIEEHILIRHFLDNLSIALIELEKDRRPPREFFDKAIEFALNFMDEFHHYKEEYVMFTQLEYLKDGALGGQIKSLKQQHVRGRNYIQKISDSLDGYVKGNDCDIAAIIENMAAYISLLKNHLHMEEYILFPMVKETFPENVLRGLVQLYNKEDQKNGGETLKCSRKLIEQMNRLFIGDTNSRYPFNGCPDYRNTNEVCVKNQQRRGFQWTNHIK